MQTQLAKAIFSGAGLAGLLTGASNIFNNERNAQINQDMQIKELAYKDKVLEFDKYKFEKEFELRQSSVGEFRSLGSESSNSLTKTIEKLESTSQLTEENPLSIMNHLSPKNSVMNLENECSKVPESLQMNVSPNISSVLEWDHFLIDSNTQNMVYSLTYSYMCFSVATLLAALNLGFNYLNSVYGDKLVVKLPKWVYPIYQFFKKYLFISMTFDLSMIILFQSFSLALSLYFQIRGVQ
jgi:hypothetical protein